MLPHAKKEVEKSPPKPNLEEGEIECEEAKMKDENGLLLKDEPGQMTEEQSQKYTQI